MTNPYREGKEKRENVGIPWRKRTCNFYTGKPPLGPLFPTSGNQEVYSRGRFLSTGGRNSEYPRP